MQPTRRLLSVSTSFNYDIPIEEQFPLIAEAGFTHVSIGAREEHTQYLTKSGRKDIKEILSRNSLSIDSIHGPRIDQEDSIDRICIVADAAAELSVEVIVVHCSAFSFNARELSSRAESLLRVCDAIGGIAEKNKLKFAFENVFPGPATDLVSMLVTQLNPEHFGYCYDSAHDQAGGPRPFTLLEHWRDRIFTVHLSDRIRDFVDHAIPGEGFIQWDGLSNILSRSSLSPPLLLEVAMTHSLEKDPERFLHRTYAQGSMIYDRVFPVLT